MTPKELLEACDAVDDDCDCSGGVFAELTSYVRSTVRLDDDDPPTTQWCASVGVPFGRDDRSARKGMVVVKFMAGMAMPATSVLLRGSFVKINPTRRDVRDLCRVVGVELKEPDHAEP